MLPKNYKAPAGSSDFFQLQEGMNRIRIMTAIEVGWEGWKDNKPFRRKGEEKNIEDDEVDIDQKYSKKPKINHVWAMVVWDYESESLKLFTMTQKTVMKKIDGLENDEDWGDSRNYDIGIEKIVKGGRTSYEVTSYPPKALAKEIASEFKKTELDVDSVFREADDSDEEYDNYNNKGGKKKKFAKEF